MTIKPGAAFVARGRIVVLISQQDERCIVVPIRSSHGRPGKRHRADVQLASGCVAMCGQAFVLDEKELQPIALETAGTEMQSLVIALVRNQQANATEANAIHDKAHAAWAFRNKPGNDLAP